MSTILNWYKNGKSILMIQRMKKITANMNRSDRKTYCPISIKETIQWFPFCSIAENTEGIIETYISLIPSLLKIFAMFQIRLFHFKHNDEENVVQTIAIKCINCDRITGLFLKVKTVKEMITKFVLNTVLQHVSLSWIISSNNKMKYDIKENHHPDWLNKGPQYNKAICSKYNGTLFDDFIRNDGTYRCNIMCSITEHDKL